MKTRELNRLLYFIISIVLISFYIIFTIDDISFANFFPRAEKLSAPVPVPCVMPSIDESLSPPPIDYDVGNLMISNSTSERIFEKKKLAVIVPMRDAMEEVDKRSNHISQCPHHIIISIAYSFSSSHRIYISS